MKYKIVPVTAYQQNCSIIWCEDTLHAAVVDPGGDTDKIGAAIDELGLQMKKVLLTHGHLDHVGGTVEIAGRYDIPIIGPHKDDSFWIDDMYDAQLAMMGLPSAGRFTPQQWLNENDEISLGNVRLNVLHCPGHTPGHVVFVAKKAKLLFVGDVLFAGSIGRSDFPRGNGQQLIQSIRSKLWPLGDDMTFIPGHGPCSTIGEERRSNPFVADKRFG